MHLITRKKPEGKRLLFMATCICDAFFDDAARASVEVLEYLGCQVVFPEGQTCCGQPAFNAGDWKASRKVVRHTLEVFKGEEPVVAPSGSCTAMLAHGAPLEFEEEKDLGKVLDLADRSWELADYIVNGLGITEWKGRFPHKIAFHRSCHSRGTGSGEAAIQLFSSIDGLDLAEFGEMDQCCGFGGTFSVSFPNISAAMGRLKIEYVTAAKPDYLVSGDMGCLLHLGGMLDKEDTQPLPRLHIAQVLRDSLKNGGLL